MALDEVMELELTLDISGGVTGLFTAIEMVALA
jgi:hypothetical protein